jgi:outer membrane lipoprotein-sorting protein
MLMFGIAARTALALSLSPAPSAPAAPPVHAIAAISIPLVAGGGAGSGAALAADTVVDNVQKFYARIKQVSATFRQTVEYANFGTDKTTDGSVLIAKPGKMRWDYVEKRKGKIEVVKSFISNGQYLYLVEHDNKQVSKKNLQNDVMPVAISFLYGTGNLKAEFSAELDTTGKYGDPKSDLVLKLTPKQPSAQYKNLYLVVNSQDFHVSQSIIIDANNN